LLIIHGLLLGGKPWLLKDLSFQPLPSLGWCSVLKVHCSDMRMSEEEKEMSSDEKPALTLPEEDLLPLKPKSQTGRQKRKGNNRPPPEFKRQHSS